MTKKIIINKIISGGQSGVDRSALDFSIKYNIPHGGYCPKNRWAEDGPIPNIYNLTETKGESPETRTYENVLSSDGTLLIYKDIRDEGSMKTIVFCKQNNKAILEIKLLRAFDKEQFVLWIKLNQIKVLNIAGPRESNSPGIYKETTPLLETLFFG